MKRPYILTILILVLLAIFLAYKFSLPFFDTGKQLSIVISPFGSQDASGKWQGEVAPFMSNLENGVDLGNKLPLCEQAFSGYLSQQPVLVLVSGIGKVKSAVCLTDVLEKYRGRIKEVILSGTAGITPNLGARVGDLCINSVSANFDSQYYSSDQPNTDYPNPSFWTNSDSDTSGQSISQGDLANQIFRVTKSVTWNDPPTQVNQINSQYHPDTRSLMVFGPDECIEISGDLFWHDTRMDLQARQMAAKLLNSSRGLNKTVQNTVMVTSMEAFSLGNVIRWQNSAFGTQIDFAYVRGADNFDHPPLNPYGIPDRSPKVSLESGMVNESVEYASQMAAKPILKLFELRNKPQI
jgi:hypothetical protein